ncbi:MAG TPA: discoidin domain-containing protein [Thermoanaerobaculia bacterium]|nr:discoidin domain-containing protein [Thermoanaerobaculia bacterium]
MRRFVLIALVLAACREAPVSPPARAAQDSGAPQSQPDDSERGNLLNIALGASVVSRTAELTLDYSALRAIDGDPASSWRSTSYDAKDQTIVFALPARTRIEKIGIRTEREESFRAGGLQVDSSIDGVNFAPLASLKLAATGDLQLFPIPPRDIVYLRVTTAEAPGRFATLQSVQVRGQWEETPKQQPIAGCWSINRFASQFKTDRGRIVGTIAGDHPISLDGDWDGLVYRFLWISGPDRGFGLITTAPDGKHLSGLRWYMEPTAESSAESWFSERSSCSRAPASEDVRLLFLRRSGRLPLYGSDEATLDFLARVPGRGRLISREFRQPTAEENRRRAQARLDSLREAMKKRGGDSTRFDWVATGSENPPRPIENEMMRVLYSVIDLETR